MAAEPSITLGEIRQPITRDRLRLRMEAAIERMIAALDAMDFDPDLEAVNEDGGDIQDEPHDDEEGEFCLGAATGNGNQENWAQGLNSDIEEACDGEGDDPSGMDDGIGDLDGYTEQTGLPYAGRGLMLIQEDVEAARAASVRLGALITRLGRKEAGSAVRS